MPAAEARPATPQPEQPKFPTLSVEFGDTEKYRYISQAEVREALAGFGYGESKMAVDAMYISPDGEIGVAVAHYTQEQFRDHFVGKEIVRGVDGEESMAQASLLLMHFTGRIPEGQIPLLGKTTVTRVFPIVPTADVNIVVTPPTQDGKRFTGNAQMIIGTTVVAEAELSGFIDDKRAIDLVRRRREAVQKRTPLLFPLAE